MYVYMLTKYLFSMLTKISLFQSLFELFELFYVFSFTYTFVKFGNSLGVAHRNKKVYICA